MKRVIKANRYGLMNPAVLRGEASSTGYASQKYQVLAFFILKNAFSHRENTFFKMKSGTLLEKLCTSSCVTSHTLICKFLTKLYMYGQKTFLEEFIEMISMVSYTKKRLFAVNLAFHIVFKYNFEVFGYYVDDVNIKQQHLQSTSLLSDAQSRTLVQLKTDKSPLFLQYLYSNALHNHNSVHFVTHKYMTPYTCAYVPIHLTVLFVPLLDPLNRVQRMEINWLPIG